MNTKAAQIVAMPVPKYRDNSKKPIRFDHLNPGSLFRIDSEPSRNIAKSTDTGIYRKDLVGFFATSAYDSNKGVVLFPYDKVMPVVRLKDGQVQRDIVKSQAR